MAKRSASSKGLGSTRRSVVDAFLARPAELAAKINIAERAITARLKGAEKISPAEHLALEDALQSLRVLIADLKARGNGQSDGDESKKPFG